MYNLDYVVQHFIEDEPNAAYIAALFIDRQKAYMLSQQIEVGKVNLSALGFAEETREADADTIIESFKESVKFSSYEYWIQTAKYYWSVDAKTKAIGTLLAIPNATKYKGSIFEDFLYETVDSPDMPECTKILERAESITPAYDIERVPELLSTGTEGDLIQAGACIYHFADEGLVNHFSNYVTLWCTHRDKLGTEMKELCEVILVTTQRNEGMLRSYGLVKELYRLWDSEESKRILLNLRNILGRADPIGFWLCKDFSVGKERIDFLLEGLPATYLPSKRFWDIFGKGGEQAFKMLADSLALGTVDREELLYLIVCSKIDDLGFWAVAVGYLLHDENYSLLKDFAKASSRTLDMAFLIDALRERKQDVDTISKIADIARRRDTPSMRVVVSTLAQLGSIKELGLQSVERTYEYLLTLIKEDVNYTAVDIKDFYVSDGVKMIHLNAYIKGLPVFLRTGLLEEK